MKEYTSQEVRNVAFLGHGGSGKSTLTEAILMRQKLIDRMGRTEDGTLVSDHDAVEIKRHMSINSTVLAIETKEGVKINLIDCPGRSDFIGDIQSALHVVEGIVLFVDASSGIQVGAELAMECANEAGLPVAIFVNKLDKENTDFSKICDSLTEALGKSAVALTAPIGSEHDCKGVVDLIRMRAIEEGETKSKTASIPADLADQMDSLREKVVEAAAEGEDALMEKFFEEGALSSEEVGRGLKAAFIAGSFIPVFCGVATHGIGVDSLMLFLEHSFPSPLEMPGMALLTAEGEEAKIQPYDADAPFSAFIFKTVSDDFAGQLSYFKVVTGKMTPAVAMQNTTKDKHEKIAHILVSRGKKQEEVGHVQAGDIGVVAKLSHTSTNDTLSEPKTTTQYVPTHFPQRTTIMAIRATDVKDEDKVGIGLHALIEQDPTLHVEWEPETQQSLFSGMGDQHIDIAVERLRSKMKIQVELYPPKIRYRETITRKAEGSYRHKKQSGGRGQFADVSIRLSPDTEEDYSFTWSVFGGAIPTNFQSAIDKGSRMALEKGILAGYHVVGINVDCFDGKHHPVDSSDMAFQIASMQAFKQIALEASPIILEPICNVVTTVPDQNMGDVMGDVSQRRGRIQGTENVGTRVVVKSQIPEGEMMSYAQNLRSITGGRGMFERTFSHFDPTPRELQDQIIANAKKAKEEE